MEKLPIEISGGIFSSLPLVSRLHCREVCKTWRSLIPKPKTGLLYGVLHHKEYQTKAEFYFSEENNGKVIRNNHVDDDAQLGFHGKLTKLNHSLIKPTRSVVSNSKVDYTTFMVGSCNGFVCYASYASYATFYTYYSKQYGSSTITHMERKIYICDPLAGLKIQHPIVNDWMEAEQAIGFGYSRSSKGYKVVKILMKRVYVYSLQGGVWKHSRYKIGTRHLSRSRIAVPTLGYFASGALYWINPHNKKVVAFDLEHEKFELIPSISSDVNDANHVGLMVLGGNLCALDVFPSKHVKIWELRNGKTADQHWVTQFSMAWKDNSLFDPFALSKNNVNCLLWYNAVLSCYDPETKTLRMLDETMEKLMDDSTPSVYTTTRATPHVDSLVSLKAFVEEG